MSMTEKLAYIKKLRHLTTEEIAQQSGVPLGTLNKIFSGQTKNPAVGACGQDHSGPAHSHTLPFR